MFRVPLHGLYETVFRQVNSFDQPIRSHCLGMQRRSQPFNALMMAAVHRLRSGAVLRSQLRGGQDVHFMHGAVIRLVLTVGDLGAGLGFQILI